MMGPYPGHSSPALLHREHSGRSEGHLIFLFRHVLQPVNVFGMSCSIATFICRQPTVRSHIRCGHLSNLKHGFHFYRLRPRLEDDLEHGMTRKRTMKKLEEI